MQPDTKWRSWRRELRLGVVAALSCTVALAVPVSATASAHAGHSSARGSAAAGLVYGGLTDQGWPVVIEMTKNRRRVVQAVSALHMNCTGGGIARLPDRYVNLRVNRKRKFAFSFGPVTVRNDDGTTSDFSGAIRGSLNRARSRVRGSWRLTVVDRDTTGAVVDTCDSGLVRWRAKQ